MRFINKYAVRDLEEPTAGTDTASLTPCSEEIGKGITFCQACLRFTVVIMFMSLENTSVLNTGSKCKEQPQ